MDICAHFWTALVFSSFLTSGNGQWYLISDYYMDVGHSATFGGRCGETIQDVCLFINSHVNSLRLAKYPPNNNCILTVDAGKMRGALYRLEVQYFDLQAPDQSGACKDYLEFYDGPTVNASTLFGRYCGSDIPNITAFPAQRYVTMRFRTNSKIQHSGFKLMFIRSEPPPCQHKEYLCLQEDRCIDSRLVCDGTRQCTDGQDERNCSALHKFSGSILRHGTSGVFLLGTSCITTVVFTVIATVVVIFVCCLKKNRKIIVPQEQLTSQASPTSRLMFIQKRLHAFLQFCQELWGSLRASCAAGVMHIRQIGQGFVSWIQARCGNAP